MLEEEFKNLHLQLSNDDIRRIDEWKIAHGMKSRTEAIRAIIRIVTTGSISEGSGGFSEKDKQGYMKPEASKQKPSESVEEMVRKLVKEELQKQLNK